jgi:hypothetical protein
LRANVTARNGYLRTQSVDIVRSRRSNPASPSLKARSRIMSPLLPLLPLHTLAVQRGDGLRPELLALLLRHVPQEAGLSAGIEADDGDRAAGTSAAAAHNAPGPTGDE